MNVDIAKQSLVALLMPGKDMNILFWETLQYSQIFQHAE